MTYAPLLMTSTDPATDPREERVDAALVARGLARSRQTAVDAIRGGRVRSNGQVISKPALRVSIDDELEVQPLQGEHYVSRGAHKLAGALEDLGIAVDGLSCVDVGSSTGGFTQVLLDRGATQVTAIDVGTDQLAEALRSDPRVLSMESTHIGRDDLTGVPPAALVVADLSFISLRHVMAPMTSLVAAGGVLLPMVKPQFEVGRGKLGKGGVVDDPRLHRVAVAQTIEAAAAHGFYPQAICRSRLPGPAGNLEFFVRLERSAATVHFDVLWAQCVDGPMKD